MKLRNKLKDLNNKLELAIERTTTGGDSKYLIYYDPLLYMTIYRNKLPHINPDAEKPEYKVKVMQKEIENALKQIEMYK